MEASTQPAPRRCQWCSEPAADADTHCRACGANLAQREALGGLVVPGVTHVDPGLQAYAADPLRIPKASPTQYVAGPAMGAAVMVGGPAALVALTGLGAVAATEYGTAGRGGIAQADLEKLGQPSEAALQMLKKLDEEESAKEKPPGGPDAVTHSAPDDTTPPPGRGPGRLTII